MRTSVLFVFLISFIAVIVNCSSCSCGQCLKRPRTEEDQAHTSITTVPSKERFCKVIDSLILQLPTLTMKRVTNENRILLNEQFLRMVVWKILINNDVKSMELVLRLNLPIRNLKFQDGASIFIKSAMRSFEIFKLIYHKGLLFKDDFISTYLTALFHDKYNIVEFLEQERKDIKDLAMDISVSSNNAPYAICVDKIFKRGGVDPNSKTSTGELLLHKAIMMNNKATVTSLLKAGADPNLVEDRRKFTAIFIAVSKGKLESLKALIEFGVSTDVNICKGFNLLHASVVAGYLNVTEYLIDSGVDFMKKDGKSFFMLYHLANINSINLFKYVLDHGADVYVLIHDVPTVTSINHPKLSIKDHAALIPVLTSKPDILELFLKYGFSPNVLIFGNTSTLLHTACQLKDVKVARVLIKYGADTSALDSEGKTAFSYIQDQKILQEISDMNEFL